MEKIYSHNLKGFFNLEKKACKNTKDEDLQICNSFYSLMEDDPGFKGSVKMAGTEVRGFLNEIFLSIETIIRNSDPDTVLEDIEIDQ